MGAKTIYVRQDDAALWERAERYASARRLSMSALIMTTLERYLNAEDAGIPAQGHEDDDEPA